MYVLATLLFAGLTVYSQSVQEEPALPAVDSIAVAAEYREVVAQDSVAAAQDSIAAAIDSVAVAIDSAAVTADSVAVAQDSVAVEPVAAVAAGAAVTTGSAVVAAQVTNTAAEQERLAAEQARLATEQEHLAAEREQIAAEKAELERLRQERAELEQQREEQQKESARTIEQETIKPVKEKKERAAADDTPKEPLLQRFYHRNGRKSISILSVGYSTYFMVGQPDGVSSTRDAFRRHILNMEILEFRTGIFGMQLFNFEMGINTPSVILPQFERGGKTPDTRVAATAKTMWFAYKPAVKFYIPCTKWMAVELFGGAEIDLTKLWSKINKDYYKDTPEAPEDNFFVNAYGGLGVMLIGVPQVPVEIKAEYRHPVKGNTALVPQGIYLTFQVHLAAPLQRNK